MRKSFVVLIYALTGLALAGSLTGCVVAPAEPGYYGYDSGYYAPGYYAYPAEPSVGIGIGFGGDGGWRGDHDWHGGHGDRGGHGGHGWRDGH